MKNLVLFLIRSYWSVSGLLRPRCRFWPTCSHFVHEAVETHGVRRGLLLGATRLWRCRPGGGFGYDPVDASRGPGLLPPLGVAPACGTGSDGTVPSAEVSA